MDNLNIVVAGATGNLGIKIVKALLARKANVTVLVRRGNSSKIAQLHDTGLKINEVDYANRKELKQACSGANCVISALAGLKEVIIDTQRNLLDAAVAAGVPRFIPSDFSIDFTKTIPGGNRNLDMRRDFHAYFEKSAISATSIYNGAFTNLLTGEAPIILSKIKRILYWGDPDQKMDFTTIDNTAEFTAAAALDKSTPRSLHIAGDSVTPRELAQVMSEITGNSFKIMRAGSINMLSSIIQITRTIKPAKQELYPAWQGMQYLRDMASGLARVDVLDNQRYQDIKWQSVKEFLAKENVR